MRGSEAISYEEFVQRVRRYRRSDVLKLVAFASIELTNASPGQPSKIDTNGSIQQFALAAVAKAALVSGNDHRSTPITIDALRWLCGSLISVEEPILKNAATSLDLDSFLVRTAYEQFPYQQSAFEELARTTALLDWAAHEADQQVITSAFWHRVLGCTLSEFVGLALLMHGGASANGGVFDPGWVEQDNFAPILEHLDRSVIRRVAPRHFIATLDEFRTDVNARRLSDRYLRRFEFNPLTIRPFVELPGGPPISPIPRFALARATPNGLYYLGVEHSGSTFTDALGAVFETYVGQQLELARPVELLSDTEYKRGHKAADYVAVFDNAVLIVEAKVTPMTAESRIGGSRLNGDLDRTLGKGVLQIHNTSALIESRHDAFRSVPHDLPRIGIVVTMEPYFQANSNAHLTRVEPTPTDTPILFAAARELEHLVSLVDESAVDALLRIVGDGTKRRWNLGNALGSGAVGRNEILDRAWASYPFGTVAGS